MGLQLTDDGFVQPAARFVPELDGRSEFFDVIVAQAGGQCVQQELGVGFPCVPLGKRDVPVAHRLGMAVDRGKIRALHAPHQLCPDLGVDDAVQVERILGIVIERRGHAHLRGLEAGHVVQVVQAVVIVAEPVIGVPYIAGGPVVQGRRAPDVLELLADPAFALVAEFLV